MEYRLYSDTPVAVSLRRAAHAEIHAASNNAELLPEEHAVHELRKHCKKLRALLRLIYPKNNPLFQRENDRYRKLARCLSPGRDLVSIRTALLSLAPPNHFEKIHRLLRQIQQSQRNEESLIRVEELLGKARESIDEWPLQYIRWSDIDAGYLRGYQRAHKAWLEACEGDNAHKLHQLRKRVKDHWYHSRLLTERHPQSVALRCEPLKQLAQLLGDWRDLYLLCRFAISVGEPLGEELIKLMEMSDWHKMRLRREIEKGCAEFFAHKTLVI
ncbi:CHAD domain-containing protein [Microbulbifer variabilis]|uniref:CHAD domain-containing protein n=1 Tax=Microbulbifer variabilis TaxID=266805 RepID=UPI001CFD6B58|nr:CHAD domain-containing protein [Microbulbifer variabilis]